MKLKVNLRSNLDNFRRRLHGGLPLHVHDRHREAVGEGGGEVPGALWQAPGGAGGPCRPRRNVQAVQELDRLAEAAIGACAGPPSKKRNGQNKMMTADEIGQSKFS